MAIFFCLLAQSVLSFRLTDLPSVLEALETEQKGRQICVDFYTNLGESYWLRLILSSYDQTHQKLNSFDFRIFFSQIKANGKNW